MRKGGESGPDLKQTDMRITPAFEPSSVVPDVSYDQIHRIIADAIRAPSGDNCQPWNIIWNGAELSIINHRGRSACFFNVEEKASFLTMGTLLEGIRISAAGFGLDIEYVVPQESDEIVRIRFISKPASTDELESYLHVRQTNRFPFQKAGVTSSVITSLQQEVNKFPGVGALWITSPQQKKLLRTMSATADHIFWHTPSLPKELFKWLDLHQSAAQVTRGMSLDVLGLQGPAKILFPKLGNESFVRFMNRLGLSHAIAAHTRKLMRRSAAQVILTVPELEREELINAGRALLRLWCKAHKFGLAVQPMTAWLYMLMNLELNGARILGKRELRLLDGVARQWEELSEGAAGIPCMCLRLGLPLSAVPKTNRLSVEQVLEVR